MTHWMALRATLHCPSAFWSRLGTGSYKRHHVGFVELCVIASASTATKSPEERTWFSTIVCVMDDESGWKAFRSVHSKAPCSSSSSTYHSRSRAAFGHIKTPTFAFRGSQARALSTQTPASSTHPFPARAPAILCDIAGSHFHLYRCQTRSINISCH